MVDKAGQTCRSCLTLNPVGAPACVRCNSPLPDARQAAPPPSPWSSPPNSAPVQQLLPAPYNPATGPPPFPQQQLAPAPPPVSAPVPHAQPYPPPPHPSQQHPSQPPFPPPAAGPPPTEFGAAQPNRRRRTLIISNVIVLAGLIIGAAVLWVTRPHYLDTGAVEQTVGGRIGASVDCPDKVHRVQGTRFTCTATYDDGARAKVSITVRNDQGDYRWSVSSRRGG